MRTKPEYLNIALILAILTVAYNILEGVVSVAFGLQDESLSLLGFGLDSFIEVLSGLGIIRLVLAIRKNGNEPSERFERAALTVTGVAFYILSAGLLATAVYNFFAGNEPETTVMGLAVSGVSIVTMIALYLAKRHVGKALDSAAILADAACTRTCVYLSVLLLAASGLYHFFGIAWADGAAALGIAVYAFTEGREAFEKIGELGKGA